MKNTIFTLFALIIGSTQLNAQCQLLIKDSTISGSGATSKAEYEYSSSDKLLKINYTDSNSSVISGFDTVLYANPTSPYITLVQNYNTGNVIFNEFYSYTRDTNNLVTRITSLFLTGTPGGSSHDVYYDTLGNITELILDSTSITGSPEIEGSFKNLVWSGGNVISVDLLDDFGFGLDTIELNISYDTNNNFERFNIPKEPSSLFVRECVNNITQITFANNELFGPAGSVFADQSYSYYANNEVDTFINGTTMFSTDTFTRKLTYTNCLLTTLPEILEEKTTTLSIFPNPATSIINVRNHNYSNSSYELNIIDLRGKKVYSQQLNSETVSINIEDLTNGIYVLEIKSATVAYRSKWIKK